MRKFLFFFIMFAGFASAQTLVTGKVLNDENIPIQGISVYNMATNQNTETDDHGKFSIVAKTGDELRFISHRFERKSVVVTTKDTDLTVVLKDFVREIPGVTIVSQYDIARMKRNIGVPGPPVKPREYVPGVKDIIPGYGLGFLVGGFTLNVDALFKVLSGKSRKMRELYRYEDLQSDLQKAVAQLGSRFFEAYQIPPEKRSEFVQYWIGKTNGDVRLTPNTIEGEALLVQCAQDFSKSLKNRS